MDHDAMLAGVRGVFDLVADSYDNVGVPFFTPIADGLVEAVGARTGERALDVGCGTGAASVALATVLGPDGSLVAVDLSPAMVERAKASMRGRMPDVTFLVGDATAPALPSASFDLVVSSLVVFFLPDPLTAVRNWVELLDAGGRIGISTFGASSESWQALEAVLREFMPVLDPRMVGPSSPFASDAGMELFVKDAGASGVRTSMRRVEITFANFEQWVQFSRSVGQRVAWERMSDEDEVGVLARARAIFDDAADANGRLVVWQDVRYTVGDSPRG